MASDAANLARVRNKLGAEPQGAIGEAGSQLDIFRQLAPLAEQPRRIVDVADQRLIDARRALIQPLIDTHGLSKTKFAAWCLKNFPGVNGRTGLVERIAAESRCSLSTVWKRYEDWRRKGDPGLCRKKRIDKGRSRLFKRNRKAAMVAAYLYLGDRDHGEPGQSVAFVHEQISRMAKELNFAEGDGPSYETVRQFLARALSPAMKTLARQGRKAYREMAAPYLKRGYADVFANQVWVGDHAIHDVEVANDLFEQPDGAPIRLRISVMMDYRSRKVVGASWAWEGSSRAIAATMRRGVLRFGPPEHVYVDNGKDFQKIARGARRSCEPEAWWKAEWEQIEKTGFLARLGVAVTHCIPHHPQSKHVERFFRTMHERFDALHSTYTSGSPLTRPESTEAAMMRHRRLLKAGRAIESQHPLASRFIAGCLAWIEEYNSTPHDGEDMGGASPNEVFEANPNPDQRPSPEPAALALLLAEHEHRKVDACAVRLRNHRYVPSPDDRFGWSLMHDVNGREEGILIAFDPNDLEYVAALELDGRFLCWLECEELARFAPADERMQAKIAESMSIRRGLEKATRATISAIAAEARASGARSAEESLYSRLQLTGTDGPASGPIITHRPEKSSRQVEARPMTAAQAARFVLDMEEP